MGMKVALTDQINRICTQLDTNPFLGRTERKELLLELEDLVQKRSRLDEVFKTSWTVAAEEEEKKKKRRGMAVMLLMLLLLMMMQ